MSGRVINVDYSPFTGDMNELWIRVAGCLSEEFGLQAPADCLASLEYQEDEDDWVTGEAFDKVQFSLEEFVQLSFGLVLNCDLLSHSTELHSRISLYRYPPNFRGTSCLSVSFGTLLDRQLYPDVAQLDAEEAPKRALIKLCQSLASATQAAAFMVYKDDEGRLKPLNPNEFAQRLLDWPNRTEGPGAAEGLEIPPRQRVGRYNGISRKLLSRQVLASAWDNSPAVRETTSGYVILDLL